MKKIFSLILALAVSLCCVTSMISVCADEPAVIGILGVEASAGDTVDVNVVISDNPGIAALSFDVEYDADKLTLVKATDGKILGSSTATFGNDTKANPYRLCWDDLSTENNTGNGIVAVLTFKVAETASGSAKIHLILNENSTFNVDMDNVPFLTWDGEIKIDGNTNTGADTGIITVSDAMGIAGEIIDVNVVVKENPGVTAMSLDVNYDSEMMQLVKVTDRGLLGSSTATFGNDLTAVPYRMCWDDIASENHTETGKLVILSFYLKRDGMAQTTPVYVTVNQNSTFNVDMEEVPFDTERGLVSIGGKFTVVGTPLIEIDDAAGAVGETVEMDVWVDDNPGVTAMSFDISYDKSKLKLVKVTDKKLLGSSTATFGNDLTAVPYRMCWDDLATEDHTENGVLATLTFELIGKVGDSTKVDISLNKNSTFNVDMEDVYFETMHGYAAVISDKPQSATPPAVTTAPVTTTATTSKTTVTTAAEPEATAPTTVRTTVFLTTAAPDTTTAPTTTTTAPATTTTVPATTTTGAADPAGETVALGDVNGDGFVDAADASTVLVEYAILSTGGEATFTGDVRDAADVNGDGFVNAADASTILVYYSYLSTGGEEHNMREWLKQNS